MEKRNLDTICVQGGWQPKNGEPRVLPIYQSTTYKYDNSEQMGRLFDLEEEGYFYTRLQNPTNDIVAQKICDLEGGVAGMLTSSRIPINRAKVPVPLPDLSASIRKNGSFTVIQTSRFARASHYSHYQFVTYHYLHYHCQPRTYAPSLFKMLS